MLPLVAVLAGFMVGLQLLSRVGHWILSIRSTAKPSSAVPEVESLAARASLLSAVVLNAAPWLVLIVGSWAGYVLSRPHSTPWNWFFGTIALTPPLFGPLAWVLAQRAIRRRTAAVARMRDGT